jgi:hypothetical protein
VDLIRYTQWKKIVYYNIILSQFWQNLRFYMGGHNSKKLIQGLNCIAIKYKDQKLLSISDLSVREKHKG